MDYSVKIDLKIIGCVGMDEVHLAQNRGKWQSVITYSNVQVAVLK